MDTLFLMAQRCGLDCESRRHEKGVTGLGLSLWMGQGGSVADGSRIARWRLTRWPRIADMRL